MMNNKLSTLYHAIISQIQKLLTPFGVLYLFSRQALFSKLIIVHKSMHPISFWTEGPVAKALMQLLPLHPSDEGPKSTAKKESR
jgi:hypothetical protein